jgi:hypothetical protein
MRHVLKCWPRFFREVKNGTKRFEIRRDDRPYNEGDTLVLEEWDPSTRSYSGEAVAVRVSYVLRGERDVGLEPGFVVMSLFDLINLKNKPWRAVLDLPPEATLDDARSRAIMMSRSCTADTAPSLRQIAAAVKDAQAELAPNLDQAAE